VIDPRSMRFEGLVAADRMGQIRIGQPVAFRVTGVDGVDFTGKVQRIDAAANSVTRQVEVLVSFDDAAKVPRVAGLYAEGRIEGGDAARQMLDEGSVVRSGNDAHVWRVGKDGRLAKTPVQLGERDPRSGELPLKGGLAEGDLVLRHPGSTLIDGQQVELVKAAAGNGATVK